MSQTRPLRPQEQAAINSLSPMDRLPAEIKTEIFCNIVLSDLWPPRTPFFLGKICRGWRDFVWSSPVLWTNLDLCLSKDRYEAQTKLLRGWLSRTAKCPLYFRLITVSHKDWISDPPVEVFIMFASVSAQWKEVDFFLPNAQDCFDAISTAENSLPLLTTATARIEDPTKGQLNIFSTAPLLSVLHLHNAHPFKVPAPWHQLRQFSSEGYTVDEIRRLLHKMPNIIRCSFREIVSVILNNSWEIFDRIPTLEHLEYLELQFDWMLDATSAQILGPVKLPSLREVFLNGPFANDSLSLPSIITSLHSSHLLETFTLGSSISSLHDLIQVLENIPSTKYLSLDFYDQNLNNELLTEELLQRLCPPHPNILLPNLRSFTYEGPTLFNERIWHLFRDVLVYRFRLCAPQPAELDSEKRAVCQIQSVFVTSIDELVVVSPDIVQEELNSLVQEGLVLSLTSSLSPW